QKLPSWYPFATQVVNDHGITTPTQRIKTLQELAKKAPETTDPGQRESICQELAQQIRKEPDSIIRGEILRTLAAYGGTAANAVLRVAVKDTDADVRVIVCTLWGKRSDAEAAQVLAGVLTSDSDRDVRMAAARNLGHSHDPAAIQALGTALDDSDPAMKHRAMVGLQESTGKDYGTDANDPAAVNRWRQYVKTGGAPPPESPSLAQRIFWWYH
ncbi:MAG: HEAT repeat domain-containing protein, partial [Thermoguttaceae bacterium]